MTDDMDETARAEFLLMKLLRTRWDSFSSDVAWGSFSRFLEYTLRLNWYLPAGMILPLGVLTAGAELLLGLLLVGWQTRVTALLSGRLLVLFGLAMTLVLGVKAPLNFSVFPAAGGALVLAHSETFPFSVDNLPFRRRRTGQETAGSAYQRRPPERRINFKEMR